MLLKNEKIAVLMGGTSAEREVSLKSGQTILSGLKGLGYDAEAVDAGPGVCSDLRAMGPACAFIALHGGLGEDGSIQGMLEVMGIPYTGSGVLASALAMDKVVSRGMFSSQGLLVPRYEEVCKSARATKAPGPPWVVKPRDEGSSVGISIVREEGQLPKALDEALSFGGSALIEQYIEGREVQIGVIAEQVLGGVEVRPKVEFYSYAAKYAGGLTEYVLPPELDERTYEKAKQAGFAAHKCLGCKGATRVDLIVTSNAEPYVLEVNTIPGMTETSLLPKIARQAGMDFPALIEAMLKDAINKPNKGGI